MAVAITGAGVALGANFSLFGTGFANNHAYRVNVGLPSPYGASTDYNVTSDGGGLFSVLVPGLLTGQYHVNVYDGTAIVAGTTVAVGADLPHTVTGSKGGNAALASLITQLAALGFVVDQTT